MDISEEETTAQNKGLVYPKLASYIESLVFQYSKPTTTSPTRLRRYVLWRNHLEFLSDNLCDPEDVLMHW